MLIIVLTAIAAALLAVEKVTYYWVWHHPAAFRAWFVRQPALRGCSDPVAAFERLFRLFKAVQLAVYGGWIIGFSVRDGWFPNTDPFWIVVALALIACGQTLNLAVFARLGRDGTFYGVRFGRPVEWVEGFPFSVVPHPQYTGTLLSIWGLFLFLRFPEPDWVALPLVATALYGWNAWFERREPPGRSLG